MAGLLAEAPELVQAARFPGGATDELVIALWAATDQAACACVHDAWLNDRIERFRAETANHHWRSSEVRLCAETIRRLGDADGTKCDLPGECLSLVDARSFSVRGKNKTFS